MGNEMDKANYSHKVNYSHNRKAIDVMRSCYSFIYSFILFFSDYRTLDDADFDLVLDDSFFLAPPSPVTPLQASVCPDTSQSTLGPLQLTISPQPGPSSSAPTAPAPSPGSPATAPPPSPGSPATPSAPSPGYPDTPPLPSPGSPATPPAWIYVPWEWMQEIPLIPPWYHCTCIT